MTELQLAYRQGWTIVTFCYQTDRLLQRVNQIARCRGLFGRRHLPIHGSDEFFYCLLRDSDILFFSHISTYLRARMQKSFTAPTSMEIEPACGKTWSMIFNPS